jgi:hypothetical protein
VRLVAERCGIESDLGIKQKAGILKSMKLVRLSCLIQPPHSLCLYSQTHVLAHQIECWFSILMRRLLKRGNFTSTTNLKQKILDFIAYYNRTFAKPFQWKFKGFPDGV